MRICLVSLHPRMLSGQINSLVGLAQLLRDRGHQVDLVTPFPATRLLDRERRYSADAQAGVLLGKLSGMVHVVQRLRDETAGADVVHLNLPTPGFNPVGNLIQNLLHRPVIVGFEAQLPDLRELVGRRLLAAPHFYLPQLVANNGLMARLSGFRAPLYQVASQVQAAELVRLGVAPERIATIPNVIDPAQVAPDEGPLALPLGWPRRGPVISYVGHFNHVKGVDVLVRAFSTVARAHPTAQLVLAWSGLGAAGPVERAIAESGVEDRIHLLGRVAVGSVLRRSDVLALPYRMTAGQAAFPSLVFEALSTGVPLVTSDLPLLREVVTDGEEAEMARPDDPSDLAQRLMRLLQNSAYRRVMVERQRARMRQAFDPALLVQRYEALYDHSIGSRDATRGQAPVLSPVGYGR